MRNIIVTNEMNRIPTKIKIINVYVCVANSRYFSVSVHRVTNRLNIA